MVFKRNVHSLLLLCHFFDDKAFLIDTEPSFALNVSGAFSLSVNQRTALGVERDSLSFVTHLLENILVSLNAAHLSNHFLNISSTRTACLVLYPFISQLLFRLDQPLLNLLLQSQRFHARIVFNFYILAVDHNLRVFFLFLYFGCNRWLFCESSLS
jgi:hypothetical protein